MGAKSAHKSRNPRPAALGGGSRVANFFEDAALRISRTAALIDAAVSIDETSSLNLSGKLSLAELRNVLPWLVNQEGIRGRAAFWRQLGTLMSLADLEKIRDSLGDADLTSLVEANADFWQARWAYMGLSIPSESAGNLAEATSPYWSFLRGALGIDLGNVRLSLASNGQLMPKSRGQRPSVQWLDIQAPLRGSRLAQVDLSGIRRSVSVTAEESLDIRTDIQEIASSLEDSYRVSALTVLVPATLPDDGLTSIAIDFQSGVVSSSDGASMSAVASATVNFLAQSTAAEAAGLTTVVAAPVPVDDDRPSE